jgi:hypothetical protein
VPVTMAAIELIGARKNAAAVPSSGLKRSIRSLVSQRKK